MNLSTQDLFLRLGATPRTRTVKADQLFRKLRADESIDLETLISKPPRWAEIRDPLETTPKEKSSGGTKENT